MSPTKHETLTLTLSEPDLARLRRVHERGQAKGKIPADMSVNQWVVAVALREAKRLEKRLARPV